MILVPPLLPGLDLVTVVTKCSGGGGLQPPDRAVSSPESSGSGLITLMVGMAAVSASSSSPLSTLLMERSRLPEAALVAGVLAAVAQNGGKLKERGVRSGVFGSDPPPPPADEVSKLKSALNTHANVLDGSWSSNIFNYGTNLFSPTSTPRGCAASPSPPRCSRSRF